MKDLTVSPNLTIKQAMKALDKTAEKCLLVVDESKTLLGTLTDGDLRRSILNGTSFSESISKSYKKDPIVVVEGSFDLERVEFLLREKDLK